MLTLMLLPGVTEQTRICVIDFGAISQQRRRRVAVVGCKWALKRIGFLTTKIYLDMAISLNFDLKLEKELDASKLFTAHVFVFMRLLVEYFTFINLQF